MANEHIKTAAANLQRAAQDMREERQRLHNEIENLKRNLADEIKKAEVETMHLLHLIKEHSTPSADKMAATARLNSLKNDIAKLKKDTALREQEFNRQLNNLDGQATEFNNLASHLNAIA